MGKGDKKSKRGKIIAGSYGVRRHRKHSIAGAVRRKEPVEKPAPVQAEPVVETVPPVIPEVKQEKKPARKTATRKTEEVAGAEPKPKAPRTKKKVEEAPGDLFSQKEPTPES